MSVELNDIENRLIGVFSPGFKTQESLPRVDPDHLLICMNKVGVTLGLTFERKNGQPVIGNIAEEISSIASRGSAFARQVSLTGNWWHFDCGNMIGFIKEGEVGALIFEKDRYIFNSEGIEGSFHVNKTTVKKLSDIAVLIYPLMPPVISGVQSLLRFGLRGQKKIVWHLFFVSMLISIFQLAIPISLSTLVGNVIPSANINLLYQLGLITLVLGICIYVLSIIRNLMMLKIEGSMDFSLQSGIWNKLLRLPPDFFKDYSTGDLVDRAMGIYKIRSAISGPVASAIFSSLFLLFYFILLFLYSASLAFAATVLILLYFVVLFFLFSVQYKTGRSAASSRGALTGRVFQFIRGISKIKTAGKEESILQQWSYDYAADRRLYNKIVYLQQLADRINLLFPIVSVLVLYALSSGHLDDLSPGEFAGFFSTFAILCMNCILIGASFNQLLRVFPMYQRLIPILTTPSEPESNTENEMNYKGAFDFNNVSFRYDPNGRLIIKNISFSVAAGSYIAFVGPSGSGKSTLMRLLLGFEEPETGVISIENLDLKTLNKKSLRRQMGVVLQNSSLIAGSIHENIAGTGSVNTEQVWQALEMAGIADEVRKLPMGLHTMVSDGGGGLSGGQRQKLIIARAIVNNPRIILFDEATSALDNASQKIVVETLQKLPITKIVIAHRLETIMGADKIYFIKDGQILQSGAPSELINRDGPFKEFAERQKA